MLIGEQFIRVFEEEAHKLVLAGQSFDTLKAHAATREFKPVPLGLKASIANAIDQNFNGQLEL